MSPICSALECQPATQLLPTFATSAEPFSLKTKLPRKADTSSYGSCVLHVWQEKRPRSRKRRHHTFSGPCRDGSRCGQGPSGSTPGEWQHAAAIQAGELGGPPLSPPLLSPAGSTVVTGSEVPGLLFSPAVLARRDFHPSPVSQGQRDARSGTGGIEVALPGVLRGRLKAGRSVRTAGSDAASPPGRAYVPAAQRGPRAPAQSVRGAGRRGGRQPAQALRGAGCDSTLPLCWAGGQRRCHRTSKVCKHVLSLPRSPYAGKCPAWK